MEGRNPVGGDCNNPDEKREHNEYNAWYWDGSGNEKWMRIQAVLRFFPESCEGCERLQEIIRQSYALFEKDRGRFFLETESRVTW